MDMAMHTPRPTARTWDPRVKRFRNSRGWFVKLRKTHAVSSLRALGFQVKHRGRGYYDIIDPEGKRYQNLQLRHVQSFARSVYSRKLGHDDWRARK